VSIIFVYTRSLTSGLSVGRSSVLAEEFESTTKSGAKSKAKRSPRQTLVENTFDRVREWIVDGRIEFVKAKRSDRIMVKFTSADAYGSNALLVKGAKVAADTHARYERMLAKALADVAPPDSATLQDQIQALGSKTPPKNVADAIRESR